MVQDSYICRVGMVSHNNMSVSGISFFLFLSRLDSSSQKSERCSCHPHTVSLFLHFLYNIPSTTGKKQTTTSLH
jgi:hypothetical protein